jgi:transposase
MTGEHVELTYMDQGYTGEEPAQAAAAHGIQLDVVKLPEARHRFVLLPKRWIVERSFAWTTRFRRLARDFERLPATLIGLHFMAFVCFMLHQLVQLGFSSYQALVPDVSDPISFPLQTNASDAASHLSFVAVVRAPSHGVTTVLTSD